MDTSIRNRLLYGFIALIFVVVGGTVGYWVIGDQHSGHPHWAWNDCLYMTVITLTTVGYGETLPGMDVVPYARAFTMLQLVFSTGVLVYFASTITAFVVEGDLKRVLASSRLRKRIKNMTDHFIVCGAGSTGRHIIAEMIKTHMPVVAIDVNEQELKEIADANPKAEYAYIVGDATDDDIMAQANVNAAKGLVAALSGDKDNLYLVVAARQSNPSLRIIARCAELSHIDKLKKGGADSVVSPNFIGGMRMVAEMVRPSVVRFLDEMLRDKRTYRIEEVTVVADSDFDGKTLRQVDIRGKFGMSVLATRKNAGSEWVYNPEPDLALVGGMVLVVMGSADQVKELRDLASLD